MALTALTLLTSAASAQLTVHVTNSAPVPAGRAVYIAGGFNGRNPSASPLVRDSAGRWSITLPESVRGAIAFKFTLGSWATVETTTSGGDVPNRDFTIPPTGRASLDATVAAWHDSTNPATTPKAHTASASVSVLRDSFPIPELGRMRRVWI